MLNPIASARVLLAVASSDSRSSLTQLLAERWSVQAVADSEAALQALRERAPDVLVVEPGPGLDGAAVVGALRGDARTRRLPVLMLNGPDGKSETPASGVDEVLPAAASPATVVDRVTHHLELAGAREEALRGEQAARLAAEAANRAKDEFIAMISHELRTPLGAILIWVQLLRTEELDETAEARALAMIERSTKNLAQIIDDLLDVSRIIAGKLVIEARPVSLPSVIEAALEAAQPSAEAKGLTIERSIDRGIPPVSGDPSRLQQVVANLLANAIKFTPEGGQVTVSLKQQDAAVRIEVKDTGSGIDPEFLPHIFERFSQADRTTTRRQKGLGLGLAIARHLVELHGGVIRAASPGEGQGSTFAVSLPLLAAVPGERREGAPLAPARLDNLRILLVDDEEDAREAVAALLRQAGARVLAVGSAAEALAAIEGHAPDVLLSDVAMPGEDGYTLIARVRARAEPGRQVPAMAITAYATLEDRARALRAGFDEHISKPVDPVRLLGAVSRLARQK